MLMHVASAMLVTACIVFLARFFWYRVKGQLLEPENQISFDCKQAILKKQRLEQSDANEQLQQTN